MTSFDFDALARARQSHLPPQPGEMDWEECERAEISIKLGSQGSLDRPSYQHLHPTSVPIVSFSFLRLREE